MEYLYTFLRLLMFLVPVGVTYLAARWLARSWRERHSILTAARGLAVAVVGAAMAYAVPWGTSSLMSFASEKCMRATVDLARLDECEPGLDAFAGAAALGYPWMLLPAIGAGFALAALGRLARQRS